MRENRIFIFGASGSGTTTLGMALADVLDIPVFDFDDYYWEPTDPPYIKKRSREERIELLCHDIGDNKSYIISGHYGEYAKDLDNKLTLAIFLYLDKDIRKQRVIKRESDTYGSRILEGGDMQIQSLEFFELSFEYDESDKPGRTLKNHMQRILSFTCPVIKLDASKTIEQQIEDLRKVNIF